MISEFRNIAESKWLTNSVEAVASGDSKSARKLYRTGIEQLDRLLGGGFTQGLHCLGALPGQGKSSLALQIAANIASQGAKCIIFSLEMKSVDIAAKLMSRQAYLSFGKSAPSSTEIRDTPSVLSSETLELANKLAENIMVVECGAIPYDVDKLGKFVQDYVEEYGNIPFVIVDYLQILDPPKGFKGQTDKQVVDYNLKRLKVLSDYYSIPIFLISSFNRESYGNEITFKAFKDTGNIEYSCDTVMGLMQDRRSGDTEKLMNLTILKQRYGQAGDKIKLLFNSKYGDFRIDTGKPVVRY